MLARLLNDECGVVHDDAKHDGRERQAHDGELAHEQTSKSEGDSETEDEQQLNPDQRLEPAEDRPEQKSDEHFRESHRVGHVALYAAAYFRLEGWFAGE